MQNAIKLAKLVVALHRIHTFTLIQYEPEYETLPSSHEISISHKASHGDLTFQMISNTLIDLQLKIVSQRLQLSTSWPVLFEIYFPFHANINPLKVNLL